MGDSTPDNEVAPVGIVTEIEKGGEMVSTADITPTDRDEWCEKLKDAIRDLDGIKDVYGGAAASFQHESARLEIVPEHNSVQWAEGVTITPNLRSLSPRLRNTITDKHYVSAFDVVTKPDSRGDGRHDEPLYIIEVWFY